MPYEEVVVSMMTVLGILLLVVAGRSVYGLRFGGSPINMFVAFTLSAISIFAIGFVLASLSPTARVAQLAGMVIFYPMIFLSGATIPRETLPESVRRVFTDLTVGRLWLRCLEDYGQAAPVAITRKK